MKATMAVSLVVVLAATGCSDRTAQEASVPPQPPTDAPVWEIGEDIGGKKVMIDGKEVVIPDIADSKREMDAVAKEKLDAMDEREKERLERFHTPEMKP